MTTEREDLSELAAAFVTEEREERPAPPIGERSEGPIGERSEGAIGERSEGPVEEGGPRRPRFYVAIGAATALLLAAAAFGAWYTLTSPGTSAREQTVTEVAERFARNLTSFDHRTLDEDIAAIEADATGNFQGELEAILGGDVAVFRETIVEAEARSEGRVYAVVVESIAGERARVQAFVDQTVSNQDNPDPRTVLRRIELTLIETTDGWKVDEVKAPGLGPG